jgi:YVTN family beta-propeller protein
MKRAIFLLAVMYSALVGGCAAPAPASGLPLKTLGDVTLDGGASRFDYQSIDPASRRLYIAHLGASQVVVYDLAAQKVIKDIQDVASVHGVLAVPSLGRVYASATGDNQVAVIDADSLAVVKRIPVGQYPDGMAYDPDTYQLYVSDETGRTVSVVDARTEAFVRDIRIGGEVGNTQYDAAGKMIYVADQTDDQLVAIDPARQDVSARYDLPGCHGPHGFMIDPATHYALVTCEDNAKLVVFDLAAKRILATDSVGATPDVVALDRACTGSTLPRRAGRWRSSTLPRKA